MPTARRAACSRHPVAASARHLDLPRKTYQGPRGGPMGDAGAPGALHGTILLLLASCRSPTHMRARARTRPAPPAERESGVHHDGQHLANGRRGKTREASRRPSRMASDLGQQSDGHGSGQQPPSGAIGAESGGWRAASITAHRDSVLTSSAPPVSSGAPCIQVSSSLHGHHTVYGLNMALLGGTRWTPTGQRQRPSGK